MVEGTTVVTDVDVPPVQGCSPQATITAFGTAERSGPDTFEPGTAQKPTLVGPISWCVRRLRIASPRSLRASWRLGGWSVPA